MTGVGGVSIRKAYGGAIAIYLAALLVSLRFQSLAVSAGLTAGTALALGILASWQFIVSRAFDPAAPRRGLIGPLSSKGAITGRDAKLALALGLLKLPVLGAIVYVLIGRDLVSAPAFAAGFVIPQVAIALLALGRLGASTSTSTSTRREELGAAPRA